MTGLSISTSPTAILFGRERAKKKESRMRDSFEILVWFRTGKA